MNKKSIIKNTTSYEERLLEKLKQDPELAQDYLEAAVKEYDKDGNVDALLLAMRDVAEAQGGIGALAKKTDISRQHLYQILTSKHKPRLDNWLDIIAGLGFKIRLESI